MNLDLNPFGCWVVQNQNLYPLVDNIDYNYEDNKLPSWMKKAKSSFSFMDFQFIKKLPIREAMKCRR